jgi:hypothetical protein
MLHLRMVARQLKILRTPVIVPQSVFPFTYVGFQYSGHKITWELRKRHSKKGKIMERARGERDCQQSEHV